MNKHIKYSSCIEFCISLVRELVVPEASVFSAVYNFPDTFAFLPVGLER